MPGAGRLGDKAQVAADAHGCPGCPHTGVGPAIAGSADVLINKRPALRVDDVGIHAICCGPNMWSAQSGSPTVFINGKAAFRQNDPSRHCGGSGKLIEGSSDVIVGGASSGGGGGGGGAGQSSSAAGGGGGGAATSAASPASAAAAKPKDAADKKAESDKPASATWSVEWPDGSSVSGIKVKYAGPGGDEEKAGARGNKSGLKEGNDYSLTLVGTEKLKGKLEDERGRAIAGASLRIERAYGAAVEVKTDAAGHFEADGFVKDEPYDVTVTDAPNGAK